MKLVSFSLITSALLLSSCQHQNNAEAEARHAEMKQIISSYDQKVNEKQAQLEVKIKEQEKLIAELSKLVSATQKDLKEWNSAQNKDAVKAALSLKEIPNSEIRRSVMSILGQLKGPAAEQGIIDIISKDKDDSTVSSGLNILKNMGSDKLQGICLEVLKNNDPRQMRYALQYLQPIATKDDIKVIIEVSKNLTPSSSDYYVRYCWQYVMKIFLDKGDKNCVPTVLSAMENFSKEQFNNLCWGSIIVCKYGSAEQFETAVKALKPHMNNKSVNLDSEVASWFKNNSKLEMLPIMEVMLPRASSYYKRYLLEGFANLSHPKVAKILVDEYNNSKDSSVKSTLQKTFQDGFPGTMWFEDEKKAQLIPAKELEDLIKKFDKK